MLSVAVSRLAPAATINYRCEEAGISVQGRRLLGGFDDDGSASRQLSESSKLTGPNSFVSFDLGQGALADPTLAALLRNPPALSTAIDSIFVQMQAEGIVAAEGDLHAYIDSNPAAVTESLTVQTTVSGPNSIVGAMNVAELLNATTRDVVSDQLGLHQAALLPLVLGQLVSAYQLYVSTLMSPPPPAASQALTGSDSDDSGMVVAIIGGGIALGVVVFAAGLYLYCHSLRAPESHTQPAKAIGMGDENSARGSSAQLSVFGRLIRGRESKGSSTNMFAGSAAAKRASVELSMKKRSETTTTTSDAQANSLNTDVALRINGMRRNSNAPTGNSRAATTAGPAFVSSMEC